MRMLRLPMNAEHRALRLAPLTLEQWHNLPHKLTAWDALRAGLTLDLPDLEDYRSRVAKVQQSPEPLTIVDHQRSPSPAGRSGSRPARSEPRTSTHGLGVCRCRRVGGGGLPGRSQVALPV